MNLELYHSVALRRDLPEHNLKKGDVATLIIAYLGHRQNVNIIPVELDEPHIQLGRRINKTVRDLGKNLLPDF